MKEIDLIQYIKGGAGNRNIQRIEWNPVLKRLDAGKLDPHKIEAAAASVISTFPAKPQISSSELIKATGAPYFNTYLRAAIIKLWREGKVKLFLMNDDSRQVRWSKVA